MRERGRVKEMENGEWRERGWGKGEIKRGEWEGVGGWRGLYFCLKRERERRKGGI